MTSPNTRIVQCDLVRQRQAMRDLDALPWAAERANRFGVRLSKLILFGLLPICIAATAVTYLTRPATPGATPSARHNPTASVGGAGGEGVGR